MNKKSSKSGGKELKGSSGKQPLLKTAGDVFVREPEQFFINNLR